MKRGELTSTQIITTIMLIAGFVIVLIAGMAVYSYYNESSVEELCRISILERATVPSVAQTYIPLKCSTKRICLSLGDSCDQFIGEKDILTIELNEQKTAESARAIEEIIANAQYDCWSITGKGYLDLTSGIGKDLTKYAWEWPLGESGIQPACLICSRIALSKKLQNETSILSQIDLPKYIRDTPVPGSNPKVTYLQAFTDRQIVDYPKDFREGLSAIGSQSNQIAIVFSQILVDGQTPIEQATQAGANTGIAIGSGLLFTPAGKITSILGTTPTILGSLVAMGIAGGVAFSTASNNQALATTHCGELKTSAKKGSNPDQRFGCSAVMPVDYNDIAKVNRLCSGGILGSP